jgi:STE24 endopeptidase
VAILAPLLALAIAAAASSSLDNPKRAAISTLIVVLAGLAVATVVLIPWTRLPAPRRHQLAALKELPQEHLARCKELHRARRVVAYSSRAVNLPLSLAIGLTPLGAAMVNWSVQHLGLTGTPYIFQVLVGSFTITFATMPLSIPFGIWSHKVLLRFKLTKQGWGAWTVDQLKSLGVGSVIASLFLLCIYGAVGLSSDWWWLWASGLLVAFVTLFVLLAPKLISPIFNKYTPLEDEVLRDRLLELARRDGVNVDKVLVADASRRTVTQNANVQGMGPTRQITLFDNMLQPPASTGDADQASDDQTEQAVNQLALKGATHDEITTIVAHELAHAKFQDLPGGIVLGVLMLMMALCGVYLINSWDWLLEQAGVNSITDPQAVALFSLVMGVISMIIGPYNALLSRRREAAADWHALVLTNDPDAFEGAWRKIVGVNLADPNPSHLSVLSASHPPIIRRMAMARAFRDLTQA